MGHQQIRLVKDPDSGSLITDPMPVLVYPGDTLDWTCDLGDVMVSFDGQNLFDGEVTFHAKKGQRTGTARVRHDVERGKHFECTVTLDGHVLDSVYGVDTTGL